ncbi:hypothetical protein AU894_19240 [Salmonella enterica subsp. enterica]|uniref:DUF2589 domain-containing protein n=1 Tax=Salmonella enterica subsp. enterica serovar Java TaxID=224729 RepID=A0A3Y9C2Y2_SALEB|nr:hypothetical protein [Salmonella enterica subsp. enterica serovar Java]EDU8206691.1 hypothetical protein [Salmonella enterica subsp. diarizonae]
MKNNNDLGSIINYIEKTIQRLNTSPVEKIDEFLLSYFERDDRGIYKSKIIQIETNAGDIVDIPIINLLPINIMEMKKANVTINGERIRSNFSKKRNCKSMDNIILNEEGNIGLSIDFESAEPTELLMRILEKNISN